MLALVIALVLIGVWITVQRQSLPWNWVELQNFREKDIPMPLAAAFRDDVGFVCINTPYSDPTQLPEDSSASLVDQLDISWVPENAIRFSLFNPEMRLLHEYDQPFVTDQLVFSNTGLRGFCGPAGTLRLRVHGTPERLLIELLYPD
ncbi:hypothetical protein [Ruegeria sp. 6PALISEP08]|uniref:hypothetical protein n=1 Tax=Ruegeria sp. 6PALISEP08 TaxID=1225660 RepID=UPI00067EBEDE|nr:hypothetical protein [Ruegeria sp. 6PALISEP08]